jgi:homoserine kinase type II
MAVFTPVGTDALEDWLAAYELGAVLEFAGIAAGIENTNFFLTTEKGRFVLTLFERLSAAELPFYLELMRHLSDKGVACPKPIAALSGELFRPLCGKPAALVTRLPGRWIPEPDAAHCALAGTALAAMHEAGSDFGLHQENLRGLSWWTRTVPEVLPHLDEATAGLLSDELAFQQQHLPPAIGQLPSGPIHADLFRDNALFEGDVLGGFIDFYFAGCDAWLFDVAVAVNDWCIEQASGRFIADRAQALLAAYARRRPFVPAELRIWPVMLRAAAFRFWLSRLWDIHCPRPATLLTPHDPTHFQRILSLRREPTSLGLPNLPS